jgi:hypothetical protein
MMSISKSGSAFSGSTHLRGMVTSGAHGYWCGQIRFRCSELKDDQETLASSRETYPR